MCMVAIREPHQALPASSWPVLRSMVAICPQTEAVFRLLCRTGTLERFALYHTGDSQGTNSLTRYLGCWHDEAICAKHSTQGAPPSHPQRHSTHGAPPRHPQGTTPKARHQSRNSFCRHTRHARHVGARKAHLAHGASTEGLPFASGFSEGHWGRGAHWIRRVERPRKGRRKGQGWRQGQGRRQG